MPHKPTKQSPVSPKDEQRRLLFLQGTNDSSSIPDLDPKAQPFTQAILCLLGEGMTVHLRPGSGGRSIGIGGYLGDDRIKTTWCYDEEEIDAWASKVLDNLWKEEKEAAD